MENLPYLDIHSHLRLQGKRSCQVSCLSRHEISTRQLPEGFCSAGVHPWWLEDTSQEEIDQLKEQISSFTQQGLLWGVGETGIDRVYPEFLDQQRELFIWHLELSEQYNLPLIIHSVRAGADFLGILKDRRPKSPWIFHDFRGNETLMKDILRLHPESYFSFGLSLDNSPQVRELFPLVPFRHLFLETDEQKHLDIHDIYLRASEQLKIDIELLKSQVWQNFKRITLTKTSLLV